MTVDKQNFQLSIRGEDPLRAEAPYYSNFVSVSRLGSDVQLEFIFVDLNQLALLTERMKKAGVNEPQELVGKTVAKVIMPGLNFVQIKDHLNVIFDAINADLKITEVTDEPATRPASNSSVR